MKVKAILKKILEEDGEGGGAVSLGAGDVGSSNIDTSAGMTTSNIGATVRYIEQPGLTYMQPLYGWIPAARLGIVSRTKSKSKKKNKKQ